MDRIVRFVAIVRGSSLNIMGTGNEQFFFQSRLIFYFSLKRHVSSQEAHVQLTLFDESLGRLFASTASIKF